MAVNNFAPAEYGGYVQGADSGGGGSSSGMIGLNGGQLDKSYNELLSMLTAGEIPRYIDHFEDEDVPMIIDDLFILTRLTHEGEAYSAQFNNIGNGNVYTNTFISDGADTNMHLD